MIFRKRNWLFPAPALGFLFLATILAGCATVGHPFAVERVPEIRIGETTQAQIQAMFGEPWRIGLDDGQTTWTYGRYKYKLFGESETEDLVVRFNDAGVVASYTFNTTEHGE